MVTCSSKACPGWPRRWRSRPSAQTIGGDFQRIQFTPDLVPADLIGTRIYNQRLGEFQTSLGPVHTNLLLADEINRAPAKVQSALLEVMQERQVTIGRETHRVGEPFLVMATQNPIESEGTYPLPEAQLDRFMLKVLVDYPTPTEEFVIVERMTTKFNPPQQVMGSAELLQMQQAVDAVYVDPALMDYAVRVVTATRQPATVGLRDLARYVTFGASPRGSINMILSAKALAFLRGRDYALPHDVTDLALDVLRHRVVLSYEALADNVSADTHPHQGDRHDPRPRRAAARIASRLTMTPSSVQTPERLLHRLEWRVIRRLDGQLQGDYRTMFRGVGVDVADLREYELGDDVRHIDWNVTARTDVAHVRTFLEDRELTAWLLLDRSPSMGFGPTDRQKETVLIEVAVALARVLTRGGNRVGAILYNNAVERTIPPRNGRTPGAAARPRTAASGRRVQRQHRSEATDRGRRERRSTALARVRRLRLHQRAGMGAGDEQADRAPRGDRDPPGRSPRARAPRCRLDRRRGRRDRRAAVRRHQRSRVPPPLQRRRRGTRRPRSANWPSRPGLRCTTSPPTTISSARSCAWSRAAGGRGADVVRLAGHARCSSSWCRSAVVVYVRVDAQRRARAAELAALGFAPTSAPRRPRRLATCPQRSS